MTKRLGKAFQEAPKLPDIEQNAPAKLLMEEPEAGRKWEQAFAESEGALDELADEPVEAHRQGKTKPLDTEKPNNSTNPKTDY